MNLNRSKRIIAGITLMMAVSLTSQAQTSELDQLKAAVQDMSKTIEQMKAKIADLEKQKAAPNVTPTVAPTNAVAASPSMITMEKIAEGQAVGEKSPIVNRGNLNDQQEAASRPKDYTLDPTYRGFIPVPNTPVLIKFNAKPHLDITTDNRNAGTDYRFAPAKFPLQGAPDYGGGAQSFVNANGSQLRLDVRAPEIAGSPRFYYQNDFFGSDTGDMKYRMQHLYGQFYGFKGGFTYGVFEDPDVWPDTVDYEGPNSMIFSRRPVAQYTLAMSPKWNATIGVEKPDTFVDLNSGGNVNGMQLHPVPDFGFNVRWEQEKVGHVQFSTLLRDIGAKNDLQREQHVFGWGVNLSAGLDLGEKNSIQMLGVYGDGIGGQGNDAGFYNSDAAFEANGDLKALNYWSAMGGFTHRWNDCLRSTVSYGYTHLDPTTGQSPTFYNFTHYASVNLVWQIRKRLSVGLEGLYGLKEAQNGVDSGDHWRLQLGLVYSIFD